MTRCIYFLILLLGLNSCAAAQGVDPDTFEKGLDGDIQLLDVRTPGEFEEGHLKNAMLANIHEEEEFERRVAALDKDKPVYVYCLAGGRSADAAELLRDKGFSKVVELDGGVNAWRKAGKKLEGASKVPPISNREYAGMIGSSPLVLVDFGAPWCPPCRKMNPVLDQIEREFAGKLKLLRIDGGTQHSLMTTNGIGQMPGFILYKNGKEVWRATGVVDKTRMVEAITGQL